MSGAGVDFQKYHQALTRVESSKVYGKVVGLVGLVIEASMPQASIGDLCKIYTGNGDDSIPAEIVGFRQGRTLLMPLGRVEGVQPGSRLVQFTRKAVVSVGPRLLGRVIDPMGQPLDGDEPLPLADEVLLYGSPQNPLHRALIREPLPVGIRAIDGLLTCGKGQRIGIFAAAGVGKSTLMGMMASETAASVIVIGLIGERGREVREFIEHDLGEEGMRRSVVVAATSDLPALQRLRGAFLATAIAEYFRDRGEDVLLLMDSLTRVAMAQREVGLAVGEPPTSKGYTPSVFALLPKLLERAGTCAGSGSITAMYTVLVEGNDLDEPIADAARSILDGHIVLSRALATRNHFPAIDVLNSISRVMPVITSPEHRQLASKLRDTLATYQNAEDLINIGAYQRGSNPKIDEAMALLEPIHLYLKQRRDERSTLPDTLERLQKIFQHGR
jgi:flagellum-specific ATP synthase